MAKKRKNTNIEETKMADESVKPVDVGSFEDMSIGNVDDLVVDVEPSSGIEVSPPQETAPEVQVVVTTESQEAAVASVTEADVEVKGEVESANDPLLVFLKAYAQRMGYQNQPSVAELNTYQRRLYNEVIAAIQAPAEDGLIRLNKIINFMKADTEAAFTMSRMFRGLGDNRVIKSASDASEARELFALLLTIVNPKKENSRYISWDKVRDLLQPKNADRGVTLFRTLVGESGE